MKLILEPVSVGLDRLIRQAQKDNREPVLIELTKGEHDALAREFRLVSLKPFQEVQTCASYRCIPVSVV